MGAVIELQKELNDRKDIGEFNKNGEYNCSLNAIATLLELEYMELWELVKDITNERLSTVHKKGMRHFHTKIIARQSGAECIYSHTDFSKFTKSEKDDYRTYAKYPRLTAKRAIRELCQDGKFLLSTDGHVFAVINGEVVNDWMSTDRRHVIHDIFKFPY